jgi:uncharacterized membrane protein YoaK (UPF0700 family)
MSSLVKQPLYRETRLIIRRSEEHYMSEKQDGHGTRNKMGLGIAVGAGVGVALGVAMNDLALWIAIGMAMGIALGVAWNQTGG